MDSRQRFFIYDRKEMGVLILLGVMVAAFAFTLGVHMGKRAAAPPVVADAPAHHEPVETTADKVPESHDLRDQATGAPKAAEETLDQSLHDEVAKTGIKIDVARQVDLPNRSRGEKAEKSEKSESSERAEAPAAHAKSDTAAEESEPAPRAAPVARARVNRRYTLQVGSFPSIEEARAHAESLENAGVKPAIKPVDLKGRGRWYRLYLGAFDSKDSAEQAGVRYRDKKVIGSYIISLLSE